MEIKKQYKEWLEDFKKVSHLNYLRGSRMEKPLLSANERNIMKKDELRCAIEPENKPLVYHDKITNHIALIGTIYKYRGVEFSFIPKNEFKKIVNEIALIFCKSLFDHHISNAILFGNSLLYELICKKSKVFREAFGDAYYKNVNGNQWLEDHCFKAVVEKSLKLLGDKEIEFKIKYVHYI